jgi:hypothetical protein
MSINFGYVLLDRVILLSMVGFMDKDNARVVSSVWINNL